MFGLTPARYTPTSRSGDWTPGAEAAGVIGEGGVCVWGGGRGGGFPAGRTDNRIAAQPIQRYGTELQSTGSCQISPRVFDSLQVVKKEGRAVAGLSGMSHLMGA